jgi:uncharacterized FlaG/YvyC family protein
MAITPIGATGALLPSLPAASSPARTKDGNTIAPVASVTRPSSAIETQQPKPDLEELNSLLAKARLELRLQVLPNSNVTIMRIVDPQSGQVIREFPNEALAETLAELRARSAAHLDRHV